MPESRGEAHLLLIETSSNQNFIFGSNKLRENIGASQLVHEVGTNVLFRAIDEALGKPLFVEELKTLTLKPAALTAALAKMPDKCKLAQCGVEILLATSGKALLLVREREVGQSIIAALTLDLLVNAPGVIARGVVSEKTIHLDAELGDGKEASEAMKGVFQGLEKLRAELPSPEARFPTAPFMAPCTTTALPASGFANDATKDLLSAPALAKRAKRKSALTRMNRIAGPGNNLLYTFSENQAKSGPEAIDADEAEAQATLDRMQEREWLAVVHADGNGFGQIFLNFGDYAKKIIGGDCPETAPLYDYFNAYRRFSLSLELCSIHALREALKQTDFADRTKKVEKSVEPGTRDLKCIEVVPVVVGGDDLTVICEGKKAIRFAAAYIEAFAAATRLDEILGMDSVIPAATGGEGLGAAAGVAIIKPNYPFHYAYQLAEELVRSAKKTKQHWDQQIAPRACALDFHIQFDSASNDLKTQRAHWLLKGEGKGGKNLSLTARPYVVDMPKNDDGTRVEPALDGWDRVRRWDDLAALVRALEPSEETDNGERAGGVARSQLHTLREALFEGEAVAKARLSLIEQRYSLTRKWPEGLFMDDTEGRVTRLLDAMEIMDLGTDTFPPEKTDDSGDNGRSTEGSGNAMEDAQ
ncbi:MAG: hypothetical protein MRY63_00750 [Neomegalonema sp.]|nr:hypothetical protein [Neomegalonema sp.]